MSEIISKLDKIYLAFIEDKCHIHPTAEISFDEEDDDTFGRRVVPVIGGFESGLCFTDADILCWFVEKDIKPSEIKEYDVKIIKGRRR